MINLHRLSIKSDDKKSGFTIVEVTLAMAFLGILLILIAMVLVNISSLYQKGLVVKSVNSVGRGLVSELTTSINSAPSIDSTSLCHTLAANVNDCLKNGAFDFIFQPRYGFDTDSDGVPHQVQYGGALCTGNYTYLWNTYYAKRTGSTIELSYLDDAHNTRTARDFKMIKFVDRNYRTCSKIAENPTYFKNSGRVDIQRLPNGADITTETPEEGFLDSTDVDLYLYELTIFPISQDVVTLRAFFSGTFILATNRGDVNIFRSGDYCNPNAVSEIDSGGNGSVLDMGSEFNYCAVNKFNFAARTAGSTIRK